MKLLLLSLVWFPTTIFIIFLSLSTLINFKEFHNNQTLGLTKGYENDFYNFEQNEVSPDKYSIPDTDARVAILKKFFSTYKSPLVDSSENIVRHSDIQGIDYALIPAISMQESQGCKIIPPGSHNCWGFGIYGNRKVEFDSYDSAISAVAKTIKEAYIKRGLTNPTLLEDRWTPSSVGNWSYSVNFFIGKIRDLEKNYSLP